MLFIAHRINTGEELKQLDPSYGLEMDLRDGLIVQHDPFKDGEKFEAYLKNYRHQLIILNVKGERLEYAILKLLQQYEIKDYFFLDSSFPMIYRLLEENERNVAVRYSEFETIHTIQKLKGKPKWVWIDSFKTLTLTKEEYTILKDLGHKLCLVSPELQGRKEDIPLYAQILQENNFHFDAICTKVANIPFWKEQLKSQTIAGFNKIH